MADDPRVVLEIATPKLTRHVRAAFSSIQLINADPFCRAPPYSLIVAECDSRAGWSRIAIRFYAAPPIQLEDSDGGRHQIYNAASFYDLFPIFSIRRSLRFT